MKKMIRIHFRTADSESLIYEGADGMSVMELAVAHNVPGIDADCGGACACATCHVHVDTAWADKLPPRSDHEEKMLAFAVGVDQLSRLACQLKLGPQMDGLVLNVPASQY